jgi:hypothetical protein
MIYKTLHRKLKTLQETRGELRCFGSAVPAPLVPPTMLFLLQTLMNYEWGKDRIVITTNGAYLWSFVTGVFRNAGWLTKLWWRLKLSKWWLQLDHWAWFNSFLVSSNPLSRKSWQEAQAQEYSIDWGIERCYIP